MSVILNLQKRCDPFETDTKGDTVCCCLCKLGKEQKLADQTTGKEEGNSAEFTSSGKI